jgi:ribosomal protein L11 methylase PrmA
MPEESTGLLVLDLTSGSGGLTVACAEAGCSSIAFEQDEAQAIASAHVLQKFFNSSQISLNSADRAFGQEEDEEDEENDVEWEEEGSADVHTPSLLQKNFIDAMADVQEEEFYEESVGY